MGTDWYKSGRVLNKTNSILDFISCAEYFKNKKSNLPIIAYGQSAGGIVVGQAINLKPELFNTAILDHPFLDVTNTMMNGTLALTIDEYKEWGNPQQKNIYNYIETYSPYQNIKPQKYPKVLLIGSGQDLQTPLWQIAKYTAKLRENNTSENAVIMKTNLNGGHFRSTNDKQWIKTFVDTFSFLREKRQ